MTRLARALVLLTLLVGSAAATAEAATLTASWNANPAGDNITGYKLSYGTSSGNYSTVIDVGNVLSYAVNLGPGTYFFAVQAYNVGGTSPYSTEVQITIDAGAVAITTQPANQTVTVGANGIFAVVASGTPAPTYQWQESTNGGVSFANLANGGIYGGVTTATLTLTGVIGAMNGNQYRVIATNTTSSGTNNSVSGAATLTAVTAPAITTQPTNQTVLTGANTSFTVAASGAPTPTLQWQVSTDGGTTFTNLANGAPYSGVTTGTLTLTSVTTALNGNQYRAVATSSSGTATSNAATLAVNAVPVVTAQPSNQTVLVGATASFTAAASGTPAPTYQWQESTNGGGSFSNLTNGGIYSGVTTGTLTLTGVSLSAPLRQYRIVATNAAGTATSNAATLTVNVAPAITTQPANQTVTDGQNASFTAIASGTPTPTYQWQESTNGGATFTNLANGGIYSGVTTGTLTLTGVTTAISLRQYRAVATNVVASATSNAATLTVNTAVGAPQIATQPANQTIAVGANASFTVVVTGSPAPTYQWQVSTDGGAVFADLANSSVYAGVATATLALTGVPAGLSGNLYRLVATNSIGSATSNAATLTVNTPPAIIPQPTNQTVAAGSNVSFAVTASGTAPLTYRWQLSTDNGASFSDLSNSFPHSGVTTTTLLVSNTTTALTGNLYRVIVTNSVGNTTSNAATLTVNIAPAITTLPTNQTITAGSNGSFTVVATGTPVLTLQWQISTNGGASFTNLTNAAPYSGVDTATLALTSVTTALDGSQYRVVATNNVGVATSIAATLTVNALPVITVQPTNQSIVAGQATSFTVSATGTPAPTYQWQISTDGGINWANTPTASATTSTLTLPATTVWFNQAQFRCVLTNSAGPVTSSAAVLTVFGAVAVSPTSLAFSASKTAASSTLNNPTPPQNVTVSFSGQPTVWQATANVPWLLITNGDGVAPGPFTVALDNPNNVIGGSTTLSGLITITSNPSSNWAAVVSVTLTVQQTLSAVPIGSFDTPTDGTTGAQGSVALSGWAVADSGIARVEIWRDVLPGETAAPYQGAGPANGKILVTTAPLIDGARPDIEAQFAGYLQATRAGWGTFLLTRGLSSLGDGTYTLYAIAYSTAGPATIVGTTTITVNNTYAIEPFGTIDTPSDGATVSGSLTVTGWALTPGASCTIGGAGLSMSIDAGPLVPVLYARARADIAAAFPGFTNSDQAGGTVWLDTATLANGPHQISWHVTDSCGRQSWIGTRVVTVLNGSQALAAPSGSNVSPMSGVVRWDPVGVSVAGGESTWAAQTAAGVNVVAINHGQQIELHLPIISGATYAGYHIVGDEWRGLPIGSSLDAQAGIFAWEPAAGFLGSYNLAFVTMGADGVPQVVQVRAVVGPSVRVLLDGTPTDVQQPYQLTGWALDLLAIEGVGVEAVQLWATPTGGGTPIFVGVASTGTLRPDVATRYGSQFAAAGFRVVLDGLPSGTYDLGIIVPLTATGSIGWTSLTRVTVD